MFYLQNFRAFLLLSFPVFVLTTSINSQQPTQISAYCSEGSNKTTEAYYKSNLTVLLDSLSSKTFQNYSFYNDTSPNGGIYGLFQCRGDVSYITCQRCVELAIDFVTSDEFCSSSRSVIVWYNECILRYSDTYFFGVAQTEEWTFMWNTQNRTSAEETSFGELALMNDLVDKALVTNELYYAGSRQVGNGDGTRYGLVQCTRDLNGTECGNCLNMLMQSIQVCCQTKIEYRMFYPSCFLRYANYSFIEEKPATPPLPLLLPPSPPALPGNVTTYPPQRRGRQLDLPYLRCCHVVLPCYELDYVDEDSTQSCSERRVWQGGGCAGEIFSTNETAVGQLRRWLKLCPLLST
ncbi:cysteine-rich receptor-like protein kinase 25 [Fagus crenata]